MCQRADWESEKLFKTRLESWNFVKNASRKDWHAAELLWTGQRAVGLPLSNILIRGRVKCHTDLKRYLLERKPSLTEEQFLEEALQENLAVPSHVRVLDPDNEQTDFDGALHAPASACDCVGVPPQSVEDLHCPCTSCHGTNTELMLADHNENSVVDATRSTPFTNSVSIQAHHFDTMSEPPRNP